MSESLTRNYPIETLDGASRRLVRLAMKARKRAYAPYSKYLVGCIIQDSRGKIHSGCNVENASYGAAICAERTALVKMVSRGQLNCRKVVLVTSSEEPAFPCGLCRQMLVELGRDALVVAVNRRGTLYRLTTVPELIPGSFSREQLRNL